MILSVLFFQISIYSLIQTNSHKIVRISQHLKYLCYLNSISFLGTPAIPIVWSLCCTWDNIETSHCCMCSNLSEWPHRSQCLHQHCDKGAKLCKSCWFHTVQSLSYKFLFLGLLCDQFLRAWGFLMKSDSFFKQDKNPNSHDKMMHTAKSCPRKTTHIFLQAILYKAGYNRSIKDIKLENKNK